MKKIPAHTVSSTPGRAGLYRFVFQHALVRVFVLILLCSFSLQTVERAFAAEELVTEEPEDLITITDETITMLTNELEERSLISQESQLDSEISSSTDSFDIFVTDEIHETDSEGLVDTTEDLESDHENIPDLDIEPEVSSTTLESLSDDLTSTTSATSTDDLVPTLTVESDQMIQFQKTNCLAVQDGSFYCQTATSSQPQSDYGLFALPDVDGDLEIYVKNSSGLQQLTFNTVDDASPYFDSASDSIVWHRFINDRYQIIVYDVASGEETQLTDTSSNNMEPFRSDNIIVWQHWLQDAWQIMLFDGETITQLTQTTEHNLAPVVRNNLVVWHRVMHGEKTIEVYDLSSHSYMTIRDDNGGTISNPRMVLVYDAAMDNGDVVTRGYDLITGQITSFAAEAAPLPENIPEPDSTGETRALLSTKTSSEEESTEDLGLGSTASSSPELVPQPVATTTDLTLDLTSGTSTVETVTAEVVDIPDLVLSSYLEATSPDDIPVVE